MTLFCYIFFTYALMITALCSAQIRLSIFQRQIIELKTRLYGLVW